MAAAIVIFVVMIIATDSRWTHLMWILLLVALMVQQYRQSGQLVRLRRFADANGFVYRKHIRHDGRNGLLFETGHSQQFVDLLVTESHQAAELGNFQYTIGHGRGRQVHVRGFIRILLDRHLPHMVLDAKANNLFGRVSNLSSGFGRDQRLSLEGDFDKHFSLYAPAEYKTDALYIFTPDVMASLIDAAHSYDCEIIDNSLYLYSGASINLADIEQIKELFTIAEKLHNQVNKQAQRYADERVGDRSIDMVAHAGSRMQKRIPLIYIIVATLVFLYMFAPMIVTSIRMLFDLK